MTQLYILPPEASLDRALKDAALVPTFSASSFFFVQNGQSGRADNFYLVNAKSSGEAREMVQYTLPGNNACLAAVPFSVAQNLSRLKYAGFAACLAFVQPVNGERMRLVNHFANPQAARTLCSFFLTEGQKASDPFKIGDAIVEKCVKRPDGRALVYTGLQVKR